VKSNHKNLEPLKIMFGGYNFFVTRKLCFFQKLILSFLINHAEYGNIIR